MSFPLNIQALHGILFTRLVLFPFPVHNEIIFNCQPFKKCIYIYIHSQKVRQLESQQQLNQEYYAYQRQL